MVQRVLVIELVQFNNVDADNKWTSITNKKAKCIEKGEENRKYFCDIYTHTHPYKCTYELIQTGIHLGIGMSFRGITWFKANYCWNWKR